jgi:hypothetical protein
MGMGKECHSSALTATSRLTYRVENIDHHGFRKKAVGEALASSDRPHVWPRPREYVEIVCFHPGRLRVQAKTPLGFWWQLNRILHICRRAVRDWRDM